MPDTDAIRLRLEIECDTHPMTGWVATTDGEQRPFVGWTGLAVVLGHVLEDRPAANPSRDKDR